MEQLTSLIKDVILFPIYRPLTSLNAIISKPPFPSMSVAFRNAPSKIYQNMCSII